MNNNEPLLDKSQNRFALFPIKYQDIWDMYQTHMQMFWTVNEVDLTQDQKDWEKLTNDEQHFIKYVLAFFSSADNIVSENLAVQFYNEVQIPEARAFYSFQLMIEQIHATQYGLLIDSLIKDKQDQEFLFNGLNNIPCLQKKSDWILKYINNKDSFATRLIAFACIEGIMFSGSFCAIFWLKKRGLMPGLCLSNELIQRDESQHCEFAILLYSYIQNKLTVDKLTSIIIEAVNIEQEFISDALPVELIGMNSQLMRQYIEFVADWILQALKVPKYYNVEQPFDFMDLISLQGKTNFFERRVSEYQKPKEIIKFELDYDF